MIMSNKNNRYMKSLSIGETGAQTSFDDNAYIPLLINHLNQLSESDMRYELLDLLGDSNVDALLCCNMKNTLWLAISSALRDDFIYWLLRQVSAGCYVDYLTSIVDVCGIQNLTCDFSRTDNEGNSLIHMLCNSKLPNAIDYLKTLWNANCFTSEMTIQHNNAGQTPLHCVLQTHSPDNENFDDLFTFLLSVHAGEVDQSIVDRIQSQLKPQYQLLYCYAANRFDYMQALKRAFCFITDVEYLIDKMLIDKNLHTLQKLFELPIARRKVTALFNRQPTETWQNLLGYVPFISAIRHGPEDTKCKNPLANIILSNDVDFFHQVKDVLDRSKLQTNLRLIDYARWLCIAAARGHLLMVQALYTICNHPPEDDEDHRFWLTGAQPSPLDFAIIGGHFLVVKFFVEVAKIDVNLSKLNSRGVESGPSSIAAAIASGKVKILAYLINEANADVNPKHGHFFMHSYCADCNDTVAYFHRRYGTLNVSYAKHPPKKVKLLTDQLKDELKCLRTFDRIADSKTCKYHNPDRSYFKSLMLLCRKGTMVRFDYPDALRIILDLCGINSLDTDPYRSLVRGMLCRIYRYQKLIAKATEMKNNVKEYMNKTNHQILHQSYRFHALLYLSR